MYRSRWKEGSILASAVFGAMVKKKAKPMPASAVQGLSPRSVSCDVTEHAVEKRHKQLVASLTLIHHWKRDTSRLRIKSSNVCFCFLNTFMYTTPSTRVLLQQLQDPGLIFLYKTTGSKKSTKYPLPRGKPVAEGSRRPVAPLLIVSLLGCPAPRVEFHRHF